MRVLAAEASGVPEGAAKTRTSERATSMPMRFMELQKFQAAHVARYATLCLRLTQKAEQITWIKLKKCLGLLRL